MKIAYKHIVEYIDDRPSIDDISDKLFQLGHEHEIDNGIFDIVNGDSDSLFSMYMGYVKMVEMIQLTLLCSIGIWILNKW